jgi:glutaredoxin
MNMRKASVTIYSRPGCHLCEEAKANIRAAGCGDEFTLEEINIDEDADLRDSLQFDIPVVYIDGVKAFKHRVDAREFKRKLAKLRPRGGE